MESNRPNPNFRKTSAFAGGRQQNSSNRWLDSGLGKLPPQAVDLEEAVLGALMIEKDALSAVVDLLHPESFYKEAHQRIYNAILDLFKNSEPIDMLTVTAQLRKNGEIELAGGPGYIADLTYKVNSAANIEYHARVVTEHALKRALIAVSSEVLRDAYEDTTDVFSLLDRTEQALFKISETNIKKNYADMGSIVQQALNELEAKKHLTDGLTGIPSGFSGLDRLTSGWQKSELIILAARPAMGKTAFVVSALRNAAVDFGHAVAIFSLEMSAVQLVNRLISAEAEIDAEKIKKGNLQPHEWTQLHHKIQRLTEAPIYIDDTPALSILELRAKCRRLKAQHDIQMVVIDYLQLMTGDTGGRGGGNREQEIASISRALKNLAKELNVPVIALSQLSRSVETRGGDKKPQLSDLRESGCLTGDTLLIDATTGERKPIRELAENQPDGGFSTLGIGEGWTLGAHPVSRVFYSGHKPVFGLKTRSGRYIKATANHPFLKLSGWSRLDELQVGDPIAVARTIAVQTPTNPLTDDELILPGDGHTLPQQRYTSVILSNTEILTEITQQPVGVMAWYSDVLWDEIVAIEPLGEEGVYDATVPGVHNFVANDIIVHNSIEQDADMVCFLYRPEYYNITQDEAGNSTAGIGEVIIGKNRSGSLDTIQLRFISKYTKFCDLDTYYEATPGIPGGFSPDTNGLSSFEGNPQALPDPSAGSVFKSRANNMSSGFTPPDPNQPDPF